MSNLKEQIENVISGKSKVEPLQMVPIRDIEDILKNLGYDDLETNLDELNGWQVDFFYYFRSKNKPTLLLSGSLYYGDFKIQIDTDE